MQLQNYTYVCGKCAGSFNAVDLLENHYAEFLMRSDTDKMAYLVAISDDVFTSLKQQFEVMPKLRSLNVSERVTILHNIFGITCDLASDGTEYKLNGMPVCPSCGSNTMYSWEPAYPVEIIEMDVPRITHQRWNELSDGEKKSRLCDAIDRSMADKDRSWYGTNSS